MLLFQLFMIQFNYKNILLSKYLNEKNISKIAFHTNFYKLKYKKDLEISNLTLNIRLT